MENTLVDKKQQIDELFEQQRTFLQKAIHDCRNIGNII